jgi:hypothetical protein
MMQDMSIPVDVDSISAALVYIEKVDFRINKHRYLDAYSACLNEVYLLLIIQIKK